MSLNFLIKHRSSGKFFHPEGGDRNPNDDTIIVLHEAVHENMHWTFEKITDYWGYIKHVSSGKIIHPKGGSLTPGDDTKLVLHSVRHWGALFALDGANDHVIHKSGRYAHPQGGSPCPGNGTAVLLNLALHDAMRFQFVSPTDPNKEVLVYGQPEVLGKWRIVNMVLNSAAEHVDTLTIKVGKSTTERSTTSFQYRWEVSGGLDVKPLSASASQSVQLMLENASESTWSGETTRTREIRVKPGQSVVTWQYVLDVQQNDSKAVFNSDLLADTDSEKTEPASLQYKA